MLHALYSITQSAGYKAEHRRLVSIGLKPVEKNDGIVPRSFRMEDGREVYPVLINRSGDGVAIATCRPDQAVPAVDGLFFAPSNIDTSSPFWSLRLWPPPGYFVIRTAAMHLAVSPHSIRHGIYQNHTAPLVPDDRIPGPSIPIFYEDTLIQWHKRRRKNLRRSSAAQIQYTNFHRLLIVARNMIVDNDIPLERITSVLPDEFVRENWFDVDALLWRYAIVSSRSERQALISLILEFMKGDGVDRQRILDPV